MKKWILNNGYYLVGAGIGAVGGYAYYHFIGCASGTCAITSKPLNSTLYFAVLGALVVSMFKKEKKAAEKSTS